MSDVRGASTANPASPRRTGRRRRTLTVATLLVVLLIALLAAETARRRALYWYDVTRDYAYGFPVSARVQVSDTGLVVPDSARDAGTSLLSIRVSSSLLGRWFVPCIELRWGTQYDEQCFERGAHGTRFVLLPSTAMQPGTSIGLRGRHLHWDQQSAGLTTFEPRDFSRDRVLVLAPHPDDAEIAAFGFYSRHDSFVVTMTAGDYVNGRYGGLVRDDAGQARLLGDIRTWDSLAVPQWGGVGPERTVNLGYLTNSLREFCVAGDGAGSPVTTRPPDRFRKGAVAALLGDRAIGAGWDDVVGDLVTLLSRVEPTVIVAPHPAFDAAPDHQFTTLALLDALARSGDRPRTLLLYTNHHTLAEHYPFGPSASTVTLPPWFGGVDVPAVYSYPLDADAQLAKLIALEAMHDLRAAPVRLGDAPLEVLATRVRQGLELIAADPFGDYSYFRRAVRPNELFFVYRETQFASLRQFAREELLGPAAGCTAGARTARR